jgi:lipid-A-disaccharide synthase
MDVKKNIMIIAGEVSGDLIGAELISELKMLNKDIKFFGIGGDKMEAAGMDIIYHINKMAFLGFTEVVRHLPFIKRVQTELANIIREKKIKNIVLIDYPGFNLNFAKKIKSMGVKVFYYVSPQIWAWGSNRIKRIKKLVDKMLVVFPFEEKLYKDAGVNASFVGHPLIDRLKNYNFLSKDELFRKFNLDVDKEILLVMPGSRKHEVEKIFPACIQASSRLKDEFNLQVIVACSSNIDENIFSKISNTTEYTIIKDYNYELMKYAKFGIIKSGTSTLEAALFNLPMIIVYKTSLLTYIIGKNLANVKNIGMVNIISGEEIVPELIQSEVNPSSIYNEAGKIISNERMYNNIKEKLKLVKEKLGEGGAAEKTAGLIYSDLE